MTKQLSNCCKAGIKLTGSPNHEDGFECENCGRIIGTPVKMYRIQLMQHMPYDTSFHMTLDGAMKQAEKDLKEIKRHDFYRKRSMKKVPASTWWEDKDFQNTNKMRGVARWTWWSDYESNTENGHDYWEEQEELQIIEVVLLP